MKRFYWVVAALALWVNLAGADTPPPAVPKGAMAFFATGPCPDGWIAAGYAEGRLVLAINDGIPVGLSVGQPLGDREDRTHAHAFTAGVTLDYRSISAADGGNNNGAAAQMYGMSGTSSAVSTGLPFFQLPACEKR
jgi:hypothetical protein